MKLIDRYILKEFILYFLAILLTLVLIFYVAEFLRAESETKAIQLLIYNGLQLPAILIQVIPPAAMLATMTTLSMLNRRNELIAIQAGGIGLHHIALLLFGMIFLICCLSLTVSDRILPPLARARTIYLWREIKGRKDFSLEIRSSKIWYRSKSYIYNLQTFDRATNIIRGFGVYFFDDKFKLKQNVAAQSAIYKNNEWVLRDGMITVFPEDTSFPLSKHFQERTLKLPATPKEFMEIEKQVDTLRLKDLLAFIRRNRESGLNTKSYEVDFHARVSMSFISIVMALLVIPYSVRPRRNGGVGLDLTFCVAWILLYWILFSISLSLGRSGTVEPWIAVWSPSALFLFVAFFMLLRTEQ